MQKEDYLPSFEELKVPELPFSTTTLLASSLYLGKYCDQQCKEFMLCKAEEKDPRKCLNEGKEVTSCGFEFYRKLKQHCYQEFTTYNECYDRNFKNDFDVFNNCRKSQSSLDGCLLQKMNLERPPVGYFSEKRLHQTSRPPPPPEKTYEKEEEPTNLPIPKSAGSGMFH